MNDVLIIVVDEDRAFFEELARINSMPVLIISQPQDPMNFFPDRFHTFLDLSRDFEWISQRIALAKVVFQKFLRAKYPVLLEPNPLPILSRSVGRIGIQHRPIFQPCWRSTRFKSLT